MNSPQISENDIVDELIEFDKFREIKMRIIPMKNQFEQQYNASILSDMGVKILLDLNPKRLNKVKEWILSEKSVKVNYDYDYKSIIEKTLLDFQKISKKKPI